MNSSTTIYTPETISNEIQQLLKNSDTISSKKCIRIRGVVADVGHKNHAYFSLRQETEKNSKQNFLPSINCMMYESKVTQDIINILEVGKLVEITGIITVYSPHSKYQCQTYKIKPITIQDKLSKKEANRTIANAEGLFLLPKQNMPSWVYSVAVLTSENGDAYKDFASQCMPFPINVTLIPVAVQGSQCVSDHMRVLQTLLTLDQSFDIIVLTRGGGGESDLEEYNSIDLLRAVHYFRTNTKSVVISAIGHTNDTPLLDDVADIACITPTAAAKKIIHNFESWKILLPQKQKAEKDKQNDNLKRIELLSKKMNDQFSDSKVWQSREITIHNEFVKYIQYHLDQDEKQWKQTEDILKSSSLYAICSIPGMAQVTTLDGIPYDGQDNVSKLILQCMKRKLIVQILNENTDEFETNVQLSVPAELKQSVEKFIIRQQRQVKATRKKNT